MISAISPSGGMRFMIVSGRVAAAEFCEFLDRLIYRAKQLIYLIVDGHPTHRAKRVQAHIESYKGKLRLFFLPPYSPQLNPDEYLWNDLKGTVGRTESRSRDELELNVTEYLKIIQETPDKVRGFFHAPETLYAAA